MHEPGNSLNPKRDFLQYFMKTIIAMTGEAGSKKHVSRWNRALRPILIVDFRLNIFYNDLSVVTYLLYDLL